MLACTLIVAAVAGCSGGGAAGGGAAGGGAAGGGAAGGGAAGGGAAPGSATTGEVGSSGVAAGGGAGNPTGNTTDPAPSTPLPTLTVGGASSLTDVFEDVAARFTDTTGIPVRLTFAGSSTLAEQIRNGAPIDVFASAGPALMTSLASERLVTDVTGFATNSLTIAVPAGNPGGVNGPADLPRVSLVVCAEQVPCGAAAAEVIARNRLAVRPVSYEPDARSVLMKIRTDEADAGLVYVTDVAAAADEVQRVPIPAETNAMTTYQAAVTAESDSRQAAAQFVRFLAEPQAQALLAEAGFGPPP